MKYFLIALVFVSGMSSLALEICASRLLAVYFGTSIYVWVVIIGLVLLSLTVGYFLGGKLADAYPYEHMLCVMTAAAALSMSTIPFVAPIIAHTILFWSVTAGRPILLAIFLDAALLFALPAALLGCVSPFAIRLIMPTVARSGRISGSLYAISTVGSLVGVFLPALWLIPAFGVRRTIFLFAALLFAASLWGLRPRWRSTFLLPLIALLLPNSVLGPLKALPLLIEHEQETYYNYIQVIQLPDGTRQLLFNEGGAVHSIYNPKTILTNAYWDTLLTAPYLNATPARDKHQEPQQLRRVCIIGLAGGTIARQFTQVYNAVPIDGVELDPAIVEVGRKYFDMTESNLQVHTQDGRTFLSTTQRQYDVIAIDAYQQFYIPHHLATREFFTLVRSHLSPNGVVALNTIHDRSNFNLVQAFVNTMSQVFPSIYAINIPGTFNTVLIASLKPTSLSTFRANLARLEPTTVLGQVAHKVIPIVTESRSNGGAIFTDDRAPVEQLTDQLSFTH